MEPPDARGQQPRATARVAPPEPPLALTIPNRLDYVPAIEGVAAVAARLAGFDAAAAERTAGVAARLAALLLQPALEPPPGGTIELGCEPRAAGVHVTLRDDGPPFDPAQAGPAAAFVHELLDPDAPDWVVFRNLGRGGKQVEAMLHPPGTGADAASEWTPAGAGDRPALFVRGDRPGCRVVAPPGQEPPELPPPGPPAAAHGGDVEIGLFRPELAAAVSHCVYDAYHLTYFNESMYEPLRIAELNRTGAMVSAVAVAPDGTVAGHFALVPDPGGGVADLAAAVTRQAWRGHGLARRLATFLVEEARRRGFQGLYCDAVTVHPYTQRLGESLGFTPCAFRLGMLPAAQRFSGIERPARRGCAVELFRPLEQVRAPVEAPARHRDMIARVLSWMGTPERLDDLRSGPSSLSPHTETDLTRQTSAWGSYAQLAIARPGADLRERLRAELHQAKAQELQVVEVALDLRARGAAAATDVLEELGFFVVGLRPGGRAADWLLLQYFNGVLVDYEAMVLDCGEARELMERVRSNDPDAG